MPRLRVLQAFPVRTDDAQGYFYATPDTLLDIEDAGVWQQLIDNGLGEATDPEVRIEIAAVVHRAAGGHLQGQTRLMVNPMVRSAR